jgi:membrane protein DedA with SNARE-associated domain
MSTFLLSTLHTFSYFGLFLLLFGGSVVIPIPEEVTLLTAGYLITLGYFSAPIAAAVSVLGLFSGDVLLFWFARLGSSYAKRLRERVNKIGLEKTWIFSPEKVMRPVFLLRFITGFRFIAPIYAGFEQAKWKSYVLVDLLSICIFVPIMLSLGYAFHSSIIAFIAGFEIVRHTFFVLVLALAGVGMLPRMYRKIRNNIHKKDREIS